MQKTFMFLFFCFLSIAVSAQENPVREAPSLVGTIYVEPSATCVLQPGKKIGRLYTLNYTEPYVLQRLTKRTYWFQRLYYSTTFYVGDKGILLFDPLENGEAFLMQAIREVSNLPVTALVYSHYHADHIAGTKVFVDDAENRGIRLRIIASEATSEKMKYLGSRLLSPTETVAWPRGSFSFENLSVALHGFERAAHTDDHAVWLLVEEKILHAGDLMNPDQLPFWSWGSSENLVYFEYNLVEARNLDWIFLNGGHGNVGSKDDISFYLAFIEDVKQAVAHAMQTIPHGAGIDLSTVNAHIPYLTRWIDAVSRMATENLREKYGKYYGYEYSMPRNAEMMAMALHSYR